MAIRIVPLTEDFWPAVEAFNERMRTGGSKWGVQLEREPVWLPKGASSAVWREKHIAVDDEGAVHGGFTLKPQYWWVRGETTVVTDWQGPVSEGSVNPKYAALAVRLMRDMAAKRPALFSWGHGEDDQPVVQLLRKMKWPMHETPFCLLVLRPFKFLRHNGHLRRSLAMRLVSDLAAFSGTGYLGLRAFHFGIRLRAHRRFGATASTFDRFGPWADELWERCKNGYTAIAFRDAESMNHLAPKTGWPFVTRLRIELAGRTIGWSLVKSTRMSVDARFGDLHVGSIVDCLALPEDASEVVWASTQFLRAKGVDIVVSNQSHPVWAYGFSDNGYLVLPRRRLFVASPGLHEMLAPFDKTTQGLHLTNMDGHGPHAL